GLGRAGFETEFKELDRISAPSMHIPALTGSTYGSDNTRGEVMAYVDKYHVPPADLKRTSLDKAARVLEDVADEMDKFRKEGRDHAIGREQNPAPGTHPHDGPDPFELPKLKPR